MSARKPRRGTGGGTAKTKAKAKAKATKQARSGTTRTARPKQKTPKASSRAPKAPAPPAQEPILPPAVASPTGTPLSFGSRESKLSPAAQARSAEASALKGMIAREGYRAVMSLEPAPPREDKIGRGDGPGPNLADRERQRLAALRKETAKRPVATVRPDYFGTAEHRASAEQLVRMLAGENVFTRNTAAQTHVLLRVANPNPVPDAVLERSALSVASADPAWRQPFQDQLEGLLARYRPFTELEIRSGLTLTYGEVVALAGDYYSTPEELTAELTPAVADAIRGVTPQDEGTFLLNTHRGWFDYAMLANENQDHFSPRNWARYARHHAEALMLALDRDLDAALVRNAFADHFLTDAFASGHLRVPRDGLVGLSGALPTRKMHDEENVHGLWVQSASGFVWRAYGDDHLGTNPVHLTLTAFAVGLSLQRVFKAYRLEGAERDALIDAIAEAPKLDLIAGQLVDPRTLPRFLGEVAGLPGIREHLPVPLGFRDEPDTASILANYPPQVELGGKRRKGTPDFAAYFHFD
ncbi:hypothetical protein [Hyalangium gracile]|uniref:hypothetical protein n=1 Tax=Hyalangium gracile TaxID=394092 RepID=UPI001CC96B07|nr:hypothetical protein [Hyalangium gracile]